MSYSSIDRFHQTEVNLVYAVIAILAWTIMLLASGAVSDAKIIIVKWILLYMCMTSVQCWLACSYVPSDDVAVWYEVHLVC